MQGEPVVEPGFKPKSVSVPGKGQNKGSCASLSDTGWGSPEVQFCFLGAIQTAMSREQLSLLNRVD